MKSKNSELKNRFRRLEELDTHNSQVIRSKASAQQRIDELKRAVEEETKAKIALSNELQSQVYTYFVNSLFTQCFQNIPRFNEHYFWF